MKFEATVVSAPSEIKQISKLYGYKKQNKEEKGKQITQEERKISIWAGYIQLKIQLRLAIQGRMNRWGIGPWAFPGR